MFLDCDHGGICTDESNYKRESWWATEWCSNKLISGYYDKKNLENSVCFIKEFKNYDLKDIYMQVLLHENEDFDDDLLLDVIELLA